MREIASAFALANLLQLIQGTETRDTREELELAVRHAALELATIRGRRDTLKLLEEVPKAIEAVGDDPTAMELLRVASKALKIF
jgi:hypothetical protein